MSGQKTLWSLVAVAAGFAAAWSFGPPAAAQFGGFGGGGFGGDGGLGGNAFGGPQGIAGETLIQSGGSDGVPTLFVLVSPDGDRAWGYSAEKGEWKPAPVTGEADAKLVPVVSSAAAVMTEGRRVHAFSGLKGEWDTLELPEGAEAQPSVGQDYAEVRTAKAVSIFSARTGNWATVKFAEE